MRDWSHMASVLLDALGEAVSRRGHPEWIMILEGDATEEFKLALNDDEEGFLGWVAPDDCTAVGVVASGRLRSLDDGALLGPGEGRVQMSCLVGRDGTTGWKMRLPTGDCVDHPPTDGRLLDTLRRSLCLPTPPPPVSPAYVQTAAWLASVLECASGCSRRLTWSEVSKLHPLARLLSGDLAAPCNGILAGVLRLAGSAWEWEQFRMQALEDGCLDDVLDRQLVRWMDEGMFSRWVLSELPSLDQLLAAVSPLLVPSAARRLECAVRASAKQLRTDETA